MSDIQDPGRPQQILDMRPEMMACARHLEPFRARWPEGMAALTIFAIEFIQGTDATPDAAVLKARLEAGEIRPESREFWEQEMADATGEDLRARMVEVLTARPICERPTEAERVVNGCFENAACNRVVLVR